MSSRDAARASVIVCCCFGRLLSSTRLNGVLPPEDDGRFITPSLDGQNRQVHAL